MRRADDRYCIDVLTPIFAVKTALESLAFKILDEHVRHCVADALASGDKVDARSKTEELLGAYTASRERVSPTSACLLHDSAVTPP